MNRLDDLLQRFIGDELTEAERAELEHLLETEEGLEQRFVRELEVEALLRSLDASFDVSEQVMTRLRTYAEEQEKLRKSAVGVVGWKTITSALGKHPWLGGLGIAAALMLAIGTWAILGRSDAPVMTVQEGILDPATNEQRSAEGRISRLSGEPHVGLARNTNASIAFHNGMRMELGLEADMTFINAGNKPLDQTQRVRLASGRLVADVPALPADRPFTVETPQGIATLSSTKVELVTNTIATQIRVESGRAHVERRSDHKSLDVRAGEYAIVREGIDLAAMPVAPLRCVFDEQPDQMTFWTAEAGNHAIVQEDSRSGTASLRLTPLQGRITLAGLAIPIREHPGPGEFRFAAFAWRKDGGGRIALQFDHADQPGDKYKQGRAIGYRFDAGEGPRVDGVALRIDGRTPVAWWMLNRDLWQDFGDFTLTGLTFICPDGDAAWFDSVYLAHTPADLAAMALPVRQPTGPTLTVPPLGSPPNFTQIDFHPVELHWLQTFLHD